MSNTPSIKRVVGNALRQEASMSELGELLLTLLLEARKRWVLVLSLALVGGLFGWVATFFMPPIQQKAEYIIAAEEESSGAGWESLLAQFGLDVGGSNPAGVFQGESLVRLFKTRSMIERSLLQKVVIRGDSIVLADAFFKQTKHAGKEAFAEVTFSTDRSKYNAVTDSALYLTYRYVKDKLLSVRKPDKKQTFIEVSCLNVDRDLALAMSRVIIETVTDFYIESLTKKARKNLDVLRLETDSVQRILNNNLALTAELSDLNINPWRQSVRTSQNRAVIDLQISMAVFGELTKNLQLAEIGLRKQTPLIQIIETPSYPLERVGLPGWLYIALGVFLGFGASLYLVYIGLTKNTTAIQPIENESLV